MSHEVKNPILRGMYPDPSICKGKDKYYLVNSTFVYMPGVPIFESEDLINWKQIGNVLETPEQCPLDGQRMSQGIYAPTIRYWNDTYYMITTNMYDGQNFYVTAKDPAGPWSLPTRLPDAMGIDPSLFFEGDKCYYVGQRLRNPGEYEGDAEIWIRELDLEKGALVGELKVIYEGAVKGAVWSEGPHLYKIGEYYYIMIAEGGTAHEHSVCIARSKELYGPYENCKNNPIFTHRHLGMNYPIQTIGHADLIEGPNGEWFAVMLGTRPIDEKTELGRETFMVPVIWEADWPVFYPGKGKVPATKETLLGDGRIVKIDWTDSLDQRVMSLRRPLSKEEAKVENNSLVLACGKKTLSDLDTPSYLGVRLEEHIYTFTTTMDFTPKDSDSAGVAIMYDEFNYLTCMYGQWDSKKQIEVKLVQNDKESIIASVPCDDSVKTWTIHGDNRNVEVLVNGENIAKDINVDALTTEISGGFVGCTIGVYAATKQESNNNFATFESIEIQY